MCLGGNAMILISHIRPFDAKQKIYVFDHDGLSTEEIRLASLENFSSVVMQLITEYNVKELNLYGNEQYCQQIKEDVAHTEMTRYNNNQLVINYKGVGA